MADARTDDTSTARTDRARHRPARTAACAIACSAPASWQLSDRATAAQEHLAPLLLDAEQGGKQAEARQRPRRKQRSQCERESEGEAGRGRNIFIFSSSDCDCAGFVVMLLGAVVLGS